MWKLGYNFGTVIVCLTLLLLKYPVTFVKEEIPKNDETIYSSIWCYSSVFGKRCSFNNLCYDPRIKSFLFIIGKGSVISGIKSRNDLRQISTSWLNHSHFYLKLALINSISEYKLIRSNTVIMSQFKPDNIMHVIHDDLLPLYVTYKRICLGNVVLCSSNTLIAFVENSYNSFHKLFEAFTYNPSFSLQSIDSVTCFSNAYVGLDSDSIFYQYGYEKPHGPVKPSITGELLTEFSEYILKYLRIERNLFPKCTFIGRKSNRKILNEKYLIELIKDMHLRQLNQSISVNNLDINSYSVEKVIGSIATSKLLVGMHGAGMILAMFLPSSSTVLELIPFGIVKEHVSALYSMSRVPGVHFGYFSWTNQKKENSLSHPEYPYLLGGFETISDSEKKRISMAISVPAVHCCHDPLYLHFMYQDTYVDYSLVPVLMKSLELYQPTNTLATLQKMWFFPSHIRNIACSHNVTHLLLIWEPPINVPNRSNSIYMITVSYEKYTFNYVTKSTSINVKLTFRELVVSVWVKCVMNGKSGFDTHFVCNLEEKF